MDIVKAMKQHLPELETMTEHLPNINSVTTERCTNELIDGPCKRPLHRIAGKDICFYCDEIKNADLELAERVKANHINKPFKILMNKFEEKSLMNRDLKDKTIKGFLPATDSQQEAKDKSVDYIMNFDGESGLLFYGNPGAGKSHLLSGIVKGVISQHKKSAIFITLPRLLTELKGTFGNPDVQEIDILKALFNVDLLVIDELGGERENADDKGKSWGKGKLNEIIDARAGKSTCFSSNYVPDQLIKMYGERDFSRMVQYADPVEVKGPNKRMERFSKK